MTIAGRSISKQGLFGPLLILGKNLMAKKPWRVAGSLEKLLAQLNEAFPKRSKVSDGSIGDVNHSARASDHNPDENGGHGRRRVGLLILQPVGNLFSASVRAPVHSRFGPWRRRPA